MYTLNVEGKTEARGMRREEKMLWGTLGEQHSSLGVRGAGRSDAGWSGVPRNSIGGDHGACFHLLKVWRVDGANLSDSRWEFV